MKISMQRFLSLSCSFLLLCGFAADLFVNANGEELTSQGYGINWETEDETEVDATEIDDLYSEEKSEESDATVAFVAEGYCGPDLQWQLFTDGELNFFGSGAMYDYKVNASTGYSTAPWNKHVGIALSKITKLGFWGNNISVGDYAFYNSAYVTEITGNGVVSVGDYSFYGCSRLTKNGINYAEFIGYSAFAGCTSMPSVRLYNIYSIDSNAFARCRSLKEIHLRNYDEKAPQIMSNAFSQVSATVERPCGQNWDDRVLDNYGGNLKWTEKHFTGEQPTVQSKPTETKEGTIIVCSRCKKTVSIPKLNSVDYTVVVTKEATEKQPGEKKYTWKNTEYGTVEIVVEIPKKEVQPKPTSQKVPMYRLYNPYTNEHLLSSNTSERDALVKAGWKLDGTAWNAPTKGTNVYRLYNPYDDWHTYSVSQQEIDKLTALGWKVDGTVCFGAEKSQMPVYRLFNPYEKKNYHMLTASKEERDFLASLGWKYEGIAWYALG